MSGHIHYFKKTRAIFGDEWEAILASFKRLQAAALILDLPAITGDAKTGEPPKVKPQCILFKASSGLSWDTMYLSRYMSNVASCDTHGFAYDIWVKCLLLIADKCAPGAWSISTNGKASDWDKSLALMNSIGTEKYFLPFHCSERVV